MSEHRRLTIQVKYGGLGDHLFHSHLPRIAKESGSVRSVFVSNQSEYRNPEYKELIWECNPYVDGFVDTSGVIAEFGAVEPGLNLLDKIMLNAGLDDGLRYHDPELYFAPALCTVHKGKIIYDPNFVSFVGNIRTDDVEAFFRRIGRPDCQMEPRERSHCLTGVPCIQRSSLREFCGLIVTCDKLFCLASGTATLASALRKPATVLYGPTQNPMFHHSKLHTYVPVT